jgi:hypothetical protein
VKTMSKKFISPISINFCQNSFIKLTPAPKGVI